MNKAKLSPTNDPPADETPRENKNVMRVPFLPSKQIDLKWVSLFCLVFQTTVMVLLLRYSRVTSTNGGLYLTSTAVVMSELCKFFIAVAGTYQTETESIPHLITHLKAEIVHVDTIKLAVPGLLYTLQNNLLFIALSNLDAAVYQVTYQLKILTTAMFSVILLGKNLTMIQICALLLLTAGVSLVQLSDRKSADAEKKENSLKGMICVLLACMSSGFAGVYFEKILKQGRQVSLFVRNVQLSLFGIILGLVMAFSNDHEAIIENGFFQNYNKITWAVILMQAASGFVVASVMKYADNILKGFGTAISIILSAYMSVFMFNFNITMMFMFGVVLVVAAVFLYGYTPPVRKVEFTPVSTKEENEV